MPREFSDAFNREINSVSGSDPILYLLEIAHEDLPVPIRLVDDHDDITSNSNVYDAAAFTVNIPDDRPEALPRAQLVFDNVGKGPSGVSLAGFIEAAGGARGATVTLSGIRASAPDAVEFSYTLNINNISVNQSTISGTLGYEDFLNKPAQNYTYRPEIAQGLF